MNILGLVFSASSLFQQTDRHTSLEKNNLRTKSPSVTDISRPLENKKKEASHTKCRKHSSDYGCSKKSSGHLDGFSRGLTDVSNTSGRPSTLSHDDAKRTSKKKKKKKNAKLNKPHLDNSIALEAVMLKNSLSAELLVRDQSNATTCDKTVTEVICKSVHDKADTKPDIISSELALSSEGSHFPAPADSECFTSISNPSSEIAALQNPTSAKNNVDGTHNMEFARNQVKSTEAVQGSSIITSVTASEPASVFLEDARDNDTKSASTVSSSVDNSNLIGPHRAPGNENCRSTETCEKRSNVVSFGMGRTGSQNEVTSDINYHITQPVKEPLCSRSLSADPKVCCPGNIHKSSGTKEADKYARRKDVKSSYQCSKISDIPAVVTIQNPLGVKEADKRISNMEITSSNLGSVVPDVSASDLSKENSLISNSTSRLPYRMSNGMKIGKENANFTWKRTGRYIGSLQTDGKKISDPNHPCLDAASSDTTSVLKHSSSVGDGLLPPSHFCNYSNDSFQQKLKYPEASIQKIHKSQRRISGEASEWVTRESSHPGYGQIVMRPRNDVVGNIFWERSKNKLFLPPKQDNNNHGRKGLWVSKPNLGKPEMGPEDGAGTTSTEGRKFEPFHFSLIEEDKSSVCSGIELHYDSTAKEFTSRVNLPKWIPVSKKESVMLKTSTDIDHTNIVKVNKHQEVDNGAFIGASSVLDITKDVHKSNELAYGGQGNFGKDKRYYCSTSDCKLKNFPIYICSDLAERSLKATYASQIASESFQLATGSPIAEFEKLLYSASPVIIPSSFQQQFYGVVKHGPTSDSFIKFPNPNIALQDVWNWYEGPGNYGLQVKAEDSQKGFGANVSFRAHFVPFLSAIQLFGRPSHSVGSTLGNTVDLIPKGGDTEDSSSPASSLHILSHELVAESDPVNSKECTRPSGIATSDGNGCSTCTSSVCPSDGSHVIFEYFEHDPPQQRKPLFAKIKELLEVGTANSQVLGDPSKLEYLDLQDLNPASWYSVAWYPIYRIPEGCFRASFLTYHSLGYLHLRCTKSDSIEEKAFCVVSPALGMQSYNAQGECWFYPKKPAGSLLKDSKPVDVSELLKERLRTLEETAALFSRGRVWKNHTMVTNKHPDFEFFLSRKH